MNFELSQNESVEINKPIAKGRLANQKEGLRTFFLIRFLAANRVYAISAYRGANYPDCYLLWRQR